MLYEIELELVGLDDPDERAVLNDSVTTVVEGIAYNRATGEPPKSIVKFAEFLADDRARYGDVRVVISRFQPNYVTATAIRPEGYTVSRGARHTVLAEFDVASLKNRRLAAEKAEQERKAREQMEVIVRVTYSTADFLGDDIARIDEANNGEHTTRIVADALKDLGPRVITRNVEAVSAQRVDGPAPAEPENTDGSGEANTATAEPDKYRVYGLIFLDDATLDDDGK